MGETVHIERWNNTLRQHLAHFVRKTLSFSKCIHWGNGNFSNDVDTGLILSEARRFHIPNVARGNEKTVKIYHYCIRYPNLAPFFCLTPLYPYSFRDSKQVGVQHGGQGKELSRALAAWLQLEYRQSLAKRPPEHGALGQPRLEKFDVRQRN